jgi:hypothetical protein
MLRNLILLVIAFVFALIGSVGTGRVGLLAIAVALSFAGTANAQEERFQFPGTTCTAGAPYLHCPDRESSGATVINQGNVVVRLDKEHTEGLEPKVTEELIKLMLSGRGGKLQQITTTSASTQEKR